MPELKIDNRHVKVESGDTILHAAEKLGIDIPTMCFDKSCRPQTSCMICVVEANGENRLVPACGAIAEDGMEVVTDSDNIRQARKAAIELLLSEHVGDCVGPCQLGCPAGMNIPLMIRQLAAGKTGDAIRTIKEDIALPAVLGRICPAPCQKVCRRGFYDSTVSICLLERYAADHDLQSEEPYIPACRQCKNKRIAIIGAGPAGLSCAYYLAQGGYKCVIFDEHEKPGGALRYGIDREKLSEDLLDAEIDLILKTGVELKNAVKTGRDVSMERIVGDFDAIFIAAGKLKPSEAEAFGVHSDNGIIKTVKGTYQTTESKIFAGGAAAGSRQLAIRALADGKEAAGVIDRFLSGQPVTAQKKVFNSRAGKLSKQQLEQLIRRMDVSLQPQQQPAKQGDGFSSEQTAAETGRCLRCDCLKANNCKLRTYAAEYGARQSRYEKSGDESILYRRGCGIIYEPGKCIKCGLCVQITADAGQRPGLAFVGRGFDVRIDVPFDRPLAEGLAETAERCVSACPTGALAFDGYLR